ncbi:hypothetical protein [Streptomyces sp. NPDC086777]
MTVRQARVTHLVRTFAGSGTKEADLHAESLRQESGLLRRAAAV